MPFTQRTLGNFSIEGIEYDVYIDDTAYGGSSSDSKFNNLHFNYPIQTGDSPFIVRTRPSEVTLPFLKETTSDDTLQGLISGAKEQRFKVRVDREGSIFWTGFVLNDSLQIPDMAKPVEFTIKAIDGLGLLKKIDYNNDGTRYTGRETLLNHIFNCLEKIDTGYFYSATEDFLKVTCNWYEDQHVVTTTLDPLVVTNTDHDVFYEVNDKGIYKYKSCLDVLEYCLQIVGAYIIQSGGVWRIIQYNERTNATFTEFVYDVDRTHISTDTGATYEATAVGSGQTLPRRLTGGYFGDYAPLNKAVLLYDHNTARNLLSGAVFNYSLANNNQGDLTVGNIDVDGQEQIILKGTINFKTWWLIPQNQDTYRHEWKVKLKVGNKYLRRDIINNGYNFSYSIITWEDEESWYYVSTPNIFQAGTTSPSTIVESSVSFFATTPDLQEEGDIIFDCFWHQCIGINGQTYATTLSNANLYIEYNLATKEMRLLHNGEQADMETIRTYKVDNDTTGNSTNLELDTVIGDGPFRVTSNRLKVYNGSAWVISADWRVDDTGTAYEIQELLLRQIMAMQKDGAKKYIGSIRGEVFPHTRIAIDSDYYLFEGGRYDTNMDTWRGTWVQISSDTTGVTTDTPDTEGPTDAPIEFPGQLDTEGLVDNNTPAETGLTTQSPETTTGGLNPGYVDVVQAPGVNLTTFTGGDTVILVGPTGNTATVEVAVTPQAGDDTLQIVPTYLDAGFQAGANIIPNPVQAVPEAQTSGEVVQDFFTPGTIDKPDYYFKTNIQTTFFLPTLVPYGNFLVVGAVDFNITFPPEYDGTQITTIYTAFITAGSGAGTTDILYQKNGSTFHTASIASGTLTANEVLTTPVSISTGDWIRVRVNTISATAPKGLNASFVMEDKPLYLEKLTYQLNRVVTTDLLLWYRCNYAAYAPIGSGSSYFDGASYLNCGDDTGLELTTSITLSAWVNFEDAATGAGTIAGKRKALDGYALELASGIIDFRVEDQLLCTFSTSNISNNKWHHLAGWTDGTDVKIYLDGVEMDSESVSASLSTPVTDFAIGAAHNNGLETGYINGSISNVRLWSRALTIDEIQQEMTLKYTELSASLKVNMVSAWELDNLSTTEAPDSHGDNTGTLS